MTVMVGDKLANWSFTHCFEFFAAQKYIIGVEGAINKKCTSGGASSL
jgi:hypothetical protein